MAPLNPYAPLYQPNSILLPPLEYYYPPLYRSLPPPPPPPPPPSFQFYFSQNPLETTVFCSLPSPPIPDPYVGYHATAPHTLQTCFTAKELGCVESVHEPWVMALPLSPFLQQAKVPVSFVDEVSEVQREISAAKIEEVVEEEAKDGKGMESRGSGCAASRARRIWRPKALRGLSEFVGRRVWPPKSRSRSKPLSLTLEEEFEFKEEDEAGVGEVEESRTTVMIKNLPNKLKLLPFLTY